MIDTPTHFLIPTKTQHTLIIEKHIIYQSCHIQQRAQQTFPDKMKVRLVKQSYFTAMFAQHEWQSSCIE